MRLAILSVANKGDLKKERLVLNVRANTDIGEYILLQTVYDSGLTTHTYNTYWFPDKKVKTGDIVVVYTKDGRENEIEENGHRIHFLYWGLSMPIWSEEDRAPVLLYAPEWTSKSPEELANTGTG